MNAPVSLKSSPVLPFDPEVEGVEVCPMACRSLWAAVLREQWRLVFSPYACDKLYERSAAASWFGGRDFRMVCDFAGIDAGAAFAAFRRERRARGVML